MDTYEINEKFGYLNFIDENDFIKKVRGLKTCCPRAYKELMFEVFNKYKFDFTAGKHEILLTTNEVFKAVYGQIKLIYSTTEKKKVIVENLEPSQFLLDGYMYYLESYKGIPFRNDKDKFKIDMALKMKG